ncbi:unnamed protein product, partial [Pleuronectes platessa]
MLRSIKYLSRYEAVAGQRQQGGGPSHVAQDTSEFKQLKECGQPPNVSLRDVIWRHLTQDGWRNPGSHARGSGRGGSCRTVASTRLFSPVYRVVESQGAKMPQQKDIVKIAIQMPGAYPQLIQLDQKKPLSAVIKELESPGPDNYALQYADGVQMYITESNRLDIKNGCILRLTKGPGRCAEDLFKGIQSSDSGVRCDSLKELANVSTDVTFAQEFISRDGHLLLVKIVEDAKESNVIMTHTLTGFMELMDHGIVSWENLSTIFIKKIASFVNAKAADASMQQVSLDILESMVLSSNGLFLQVKQEVTMERLVAHLQVTNQQIQTKAMALLMALLQTAGDSDRQDMFAFLNKKNLRQYIYKNIIHSSASVQDEMAHYLYVLQSVTLNHLEPRMRTPLDSYSQDQRDVLHSLRQAAFETETENSLSNERRRSLCAKEFKKLGFSNNSNPGQDLVRTPPGLVALDTMSYFASRYPDAYSRFVLENSSREDKHECPFARSSIQLTLILCEILRIGETPSETGSDYHPIFFSQDRLVEELFCVCIQLLNKTWKEMRATQEDFDKEQPLCPEHRGSRPTFCLCPQPPTQGALGQGQRGTRWTKRSV